MNSSKCNNKQLEKFLCVRVLIAVQNKLLSSSCEKLDSNCEIIWTKIELSNAKDLYVGLYYRPPASKKCMEELQMSIEKLKNSNSIICLCGDFNMPDISWEDNSVKTGSNQVALSESLLDIAGMGFFRFLTELRFFRVIWVILEIDADPV